MGARNTISYYARSFTTRPAIADAGIRAGEIIGYRAWLLDGDNYLHGCFVQDYVWLPGKVEHEANLAPRWGAGLHAFKLTESAKEQYGFYAGFRGWEVAIGTVRLWGEVIEHERGYRAEYAAVHGISYLLVGLWPRRTITRNRSLWFRQTRLKLVRDKYGVRA